MNTSKRKGSVSAIRQQQKSTSNRQAEQALTSPEFFEDFESDQDHASNFLTDSFRTSANPLDTLFFCCTEAVSSIGSLHETVCGSWDIFLEPAFEIAGLKGALSRSASTERTWDLFVQAIDKCSEPEVQFQLESQQHVFEMPAVGAFSFVRLCQYLVVSRFENVEQRTKTENLVLKIGLSRRNRRIKAVIVAVWIANHKRCRENLVRTLTHICTFDVYY
jgi:hypothetical protein